MNKALGSKKAKSKPLKIRRFNNEETPILPVKQIMKDGVYCFPDKAIIPKESLFFDDCDEMDKILEEANRKK